MKFDDIIGKAIALHAARDKDYSGAVRLSGYLEAEKTGVRGWHSAFLRLGEKYLRCQQLINAERSGAQPVGAGKPLEQTLLDILVCTAIIIELRSQEPPGATLNRPLRERTLA